MRLVTKGREVVEITRGDLLKLLREAGFKAPDDTVFTIGQQHLTETHTINAVYEPVSDPTPRISAEPISRGFGRHDES